MGGIQNEVIRASAWIHAKGKQVCCVQVGFVRWICVLGIHRPCLLQGCLCMPLAAPHQGRTPLHCAAGGGEVECTKILLDAGAIKSAKGNDGAVLSRRIWSSCACNPPPTWKIRMNGRRIAQALSNKRPRNCPTSLAACCLSCRQPSVFLRFANCLIAGYLLCTVRFAVYLFSNVSVRFANQYGPMAGMPAIHGLSKNMFVDLQWFYGFVPTQKECKWVPCFYGLVNTLPSPGKCSCMVRFREFWDFYKSP